MAKASDSKEMELPKATAEQLKALDDFKAVELLAKELGAEIIPSADLGDGFSLLEDKDYLLGKALVFVTWTFSRGDFGDFVSARVMAQEANGTVGKYIINDGSTGIMVQLGQISDAHPGAGTTMVSAPRGLRKSVYKTEVMDEKTGVMVEKPATTYYIDTSAAR